MDTGAWQATVHRVTKSRTQLKSLSTRARGLPLHPKPTTPHEVPRVGTY